MGLPLKMCAVLAACLCSVSAGGTAADPGQATGASANFGQWWVRPKQDNTRQNNSHQHIGRKAWAQDGSWDARPRSGNTFATRTPTSTSRFGFNFTEHKTDHFHVLFRQRGVPVAVVDQTGDLLETAYREFIDGLKEAGFELEPVTEPLSWVVFDDENHYHDFARLADGMNTPYLESYYAARSNQVVLMQASGASSWRYDKNYDGRDEFTTARAISAMDQPAQVPAVGGEGGLLDVRRAVHEAAHQLAFNTGLQKRGVMYPLWVSEGLATNFECDSTAAVGLGGENEPRKRQLLRAYAGGRLMDFESFVTLVHIRSGGPSANDLYAQSWALFNFLFKTRRSDLKNYLAALARLEPGTRDEATMRQEFIGAFGPIDRLERAWDKHLTSLR